MKQVFLFHMINEFFKYVIKSIRFGFNEKKINSLIISQKLFNFIPNNFTIEKDIKIKKEIIKQLFDKFDDRIRSDQIGKQKKQTEDFIPQAKVLKTRIIIKNIYFSPLNPNYNKIATTTI